MAVVYNEVANERRGEQAGKGENVGDRVDVLVGREAEETGFDREFLRWGWGRRAGVISFCEI